MNSAEFKTLLQTELVKRCKANPRYSLRAFAKFLEVEPSYLSKVLSGKRKVTEAKMDLLSTQLGLKSQVLSSMNKDEFQQLTQDRIDVVSEWYHFAILELLSIPGFICTASGVSKALGIKVVEAQSAIDRLVRLKMIERDSKGKFRNVSGSNTTVGSSIPDATLRAMQMQILDMAKHALETLPQQKRDQGTITFAIPTALIPEAKERIKKFRRELNQFFQDSSLTPDLVYQFTTSLYPVSKNRRNT